ncbi:MAG: sugar phosphate isomerase/epimerase [Candidatus Latescibacteria bacterium]|nr:sugar phosphate isomerase/epimerase [Candidatus Latescibacterota bacterium]
MKLSLSGRLIEMTRHTYAMTVEEFLALTVRAGYEAVHLRDGQTDHLIREERFDEIEALYAGHGLGCSMLWGRLDSASFDADLTRKKLALLPRIGLDQLMIGYPTDIELIREWCDLAARQDITLVIACHVNSIFEDIIRARDFIRKVDRPNLGLNVDPLNIHMAGQDCGLSTLEQVKDLLCIVNVQGGVLHQGDQTIRRYYLKSTPTFRRVYLCDEDHLDVPQFISNLKAIGYEGYVNVLEPYSKDEDLSRVALETARLLKGYIDG